WPGSSAEVVWATPPTASGSSPLTSRCCMWAACCSFSSSSWSNGEATGWRDTPISDKTNRPSGFYKKGGILMKKWWIGVLAFVLLLGTTACGGGGQEKTTLRVGASQVPH